MDGESLEQRLERIRLKNEEIEKKHKEAELDRIRALKDNAMVEVKSPKHEDWPKQHKYDTLDFTYDVEPLPDADKIDSAPSAAGWRKKEYKTFGEGDGPPPDPVYNFLADSERDGNEGKLAAAATSAVLSPGQDKKRSPNDQSSSFRKSGSFRRQNSNHSSISSGSGQSNAKGKRDGNKSGGGGGEYRKPVQFDIQPTKNLETNWRTEKRDTDKTAGNAFSNPVGGGAGGEGYHQSAAHHHHQKKSSPTHYTKPLPLHSVVQSALPPPPLVAAPTVVRQPLPILKPVEPPKEAAELVVEQRGNIQIVSKDGEIQSVKLTSARATPGTGRVGLPRAITKSSQPPPAPTQLPSPTPIMSSFPTSLPAEAQNPSTQFHIPNMAYPPPPIPVEAKKFSVQDRLSKFQVPT